jgi:predicted nucleic acid-binding protein
MGQDLIMAKLILPDTDILIDFFRGYKKAITFIDEYNDNIIISSIVVAELFAGIKDKKEEGILEDFVSLFPVVPINSEIGKVGGLYKRDFGKSHGIGLADAIMAATAEIENAELKTLNIKHYPMFRGLKPAYKK